MAPVQATNNVNQYASVEQTRTPTTSLGKDEFTKILVAQMRNQDPLAPMQDTDFIAQMAQFSSLEKMEQLNQNSLFSQAVSLIGKSVYAQVTDIEGVSKTIDGVVGSVSTINGVPYLEIDGQSIPYSSKIVVYNNPN